MALRVAAGTHIVPRQVKSTLSYRKFKNGNFWAGIIFFSQNHEIRQIFRHLTLLKGAFLPHRNIGWILRNLKSISVLGPI